MTERIMSDPDIMFGKPVVRGTRITVESIVERLGAGESVDAVVDAHPRLTRDDVLAAVAFAAEALKSVEPARSRPAPGEVSLRRGDRTPDRRGPPRYRARCHRPSHRINPDPPPPRHQGESESGCI